MRWGIDIFDTNDRNLTHNARSEGIESNQAWGPLISENQRCLIVCKGFYFYHITEILDTINRKKLYDRQPYYVEPNKQTEGSFFYVAGLYKVQRTFRGIKYSVVAITQKATYDFNGFVQRIPYFIPKNKINLWLNGDINLNVNNKFNINYCKPFRKIGLWIDQPIDSKNYHNNNEILILRSRQEWDQEKEAEMIGFNNDSFCWDEIEQEALKQNKAKKEGKTYQIKQNWDNLREQNEKNQNNTNINNNYDYNHDEGLLLDEDKELKQEEYTQTNHENHNNINPKKRKRSLLNEDNNGTYIEQEPVNKKSKLDMILNEIDGDEEEEEEDVDIDEGNNQYTFDEDDSDTSNTDIMHHSKPNRRRSVDSGINENKTNSMKRRNDGRRSSSNTC